jgi:predicted phosphodiesterase
VPTTDIADDVLADLLRSGWLVEAARARVFEAWGRAEARFAPSAGRAHGRAELIAAALRRRGRAVDAPLVDAHAGWMLRCAHDHDEPFADLFLARLGGWVDAHVAPFLEPGDGDRLAELGREEATALVWPESLPPAPPFQPLGARPQPRAADVRLRIGVLGDLHIGSRDAEALAATAVSDLNRARPDLVVQLGDVTDHGDADEFAGAARVLDELEAQWVAMIGNHDGYSRTEERLAGRELFERYLGRAPDGVLLERGGVRVAVLDSVEYALSPFPPYDLVGGAFTEGAGGGMVRGALSAAQHDILADVAAPGAPPAVVFLHHPPQPFTGFPPIVFGLRDADSGRLRATSDSGNVWGVFAGHTHRNSAGGGFEPTPVREVAAPRDFPFGYALIDVRSDGYSFRFLQISDDELLRAGYERTGAIQRRYALGDPSERDFDWRAAPATP